jgi:hypothetical protein
VDADPLWGDEYDYERLAEEIAVAFARGWTPARDFLSSASIDDAGRALAYERAVELFSLLVPVVGISRHLNAGRLPAPFGVTVQALRDFADAYAVRSYPWEAADVEQLGIHPYRRDVWGRLESVLFAHGTFDWAADPSDSEAGLDEIDPAQFRAPLPDDESWVSAFLDGAIKIMDAYPNYVAAAASADGRRALVARRHEHWRWASQRLNGASQFLNWATRMPYPPIGAVASGVLLTTESLWLITSARTPDEIIQRPIVQPSTVVGVMTENGGNVWLEEHAERLPEWLR